MHDFKTEVALQVATYSQDSSLRAAATAFMDASLAARYSYNFSWMGRPIIQYPQDIVAMQELLWQVKPDLVIETGIAHGGSLVLSASVLALIEYAEAAQSGELLNPSKPRRRVVGLDIDIRNHNREAIEAHPMASRISMIQGSSVDPTVVGQVRAIAAEHRRVMVCLDSNHSHAHVQAELEAYAPLVSVGSYCVVFDTVVENMKPGSFADRPWDKGNNPMTAARAYLANHPEFTIDHQIDHRLQLSVAPEGYLLRSS